MASSLTVVMHDGQNDRGSQDHNEAASSGEKWKRDRREFVTQQDFRGYPKASPAISAPDASFCKY